MPGLAEHGGQGLAYRAIADDGDIDIDRAGHLNELCGMGGPH